MNTIHGATPQPIIHEERIREDNGFVLSNHWWADLFNLSTGEVKVARIIGGERYDTTRAALIVGYGEFYGYDRYRLSRLYRRDKGDFFTVHMHWTEEDGFVAPNFIVPLDLNRVLMVARDLIHDEDLLAFVKKWYEPGYLPRDDTFIRAWAEERLPADECELLLELLGNPLIIDVPALLMPTCLVE